MQNPVYTYQIYMIFKQIVNMEDFEQAKTHLFEHNWMVSSTPNTNNSIWY